ncbi:MAG: OmpA family protein, partial [Saprospiraceae bacterium]|nr:OmpA family protein [Saprospiraceae bacterium]MCB0682857.1 OmpA family protein [Saprospiraceae bacterium]
SYNLRLSQQRADAAVNYIVSRGISRSRISARGYGETRLVNRCDDGVDCTEAEHQANRRTEIRILRN